MSRFKRRQNKHLASDQDNENCVVSCGSCVFIILVIIIIVVWIMKY